MSEDRPYEVHSTDSAAAIGDFMKWLQEVGASKADPTGIAVGEEGLALSQGENIYLVGSGEEGQFARAALAAAIMGGAPPRLVSTNGEETLVRLNVFLKEDDYSAADFFGRTAQCMIGDLLSCSATVGHIPAAKNLSVADEAYTARLLEPQYQAEAPPYYVSVSLPLVRLTAEWRLFGNDAKSDWWVSYPDLWLRVLTKYTGDPTLTYVLNESEEPLAAIARLFEWPLERTAAVLIWHICGRSVDVMAEEGAAHIDALPDDLPAVAGAWNRRLPTLWAGITGLMGSYTQNRLAKTRYGRKLHSGQHPGAASAHIIFGTTQDLMEVAAVSFWNNRPGSSVMIKRVDSFAVDPTIHRVVGVGPQAVEERESWIQKLTHLSHLEAPLGTVSLTPTVVRPPEESSQPAETAADSSVGATSPSGAARAKTKRGGKRASTSLQSPEEPSVATASSGAGSASPVEPLPAVSPKRAATPARPKRRGRGARSRGGASAARRGSARSGK